MLILFMPWLHAMTTWFFAAPGGGAELPAKSEPATAPATSGESGARVIEFYVPDTFQLPARRWVPAEERGKVITFSTRGVRKSA